MTHIPEQQATTPEEPSLAETTALIMFDWLEYPQTAKMTRCILADGIQTIAYYYSTQPGQDGESWLAINDMAEQLRPEEVTSQDRYIAVWRTPGENQDYIDLAEKSIKSIGALIDQADTPDAIRDLLASKLDEIERLHSASRPIRNIARRHLRQLREANGFVILSKMHQERADYPQWLKRMARARQSAAIKYGHFAVAAVYDRVLA